MRSLTDIRPSISNRWEHSREGSARVDDIKSHPQGELRGKTKLVKITEDVRKFAAEQKLSEEEAVRAGMEQKAKEFLEKGSEIYART
jgi:hypothetical protein